ncbi:MAG: hypothetical protein MH204_01430 [Fimbriimonadaceae bacterium]|nr:hypothetical protein [Fimbriimonadaceae bacterium]
MILNRTLSLLDVLPRLVRKSAARRATESATQAEGTVRKPGFLEGFERLLTAGINPTIDTLSRND